MPATAVVVDDQPAVRDAVVLVLESLGVDVVAQGETATQAVDLARRHRPDVLILDDQMPGGRGTDVVPEVRQSSPGTCIVLFSGSVHHIDQMDADHRPDRVVGKNEGVAGVTVAVEGCLRRDLG